MLQSALVVEQFTDILVIHASANSLDQTVPSLLLSLGTLVIPICV